MASPFTRGGVSGCSRVPLAALGIAGGSCGFARLGSGSSLRSCSRRDVRCPPAAAGITSLCKPHFWATSPESKEGEGHGAAQTFACCVLMLQVPEHHWSESVLRVTDRQTDLQCDVGAAARAVLQVPPGLSARPAGPVLRVPGMLAGQHRLCPVCGAPGQVSVPDPARQVAAPNPVQARGRGSNPSSRGDTSDLFVHSRHRPSSFPAPAAAQMLLYNGRLLGRVIYLLCYVSAEADAGVTPSEQPPPRGERGLSSPKLHRGRWVQLLRALLALCRAWRQKQSVSNRWGPGLQSLRAPQGSDRCRDVKGQAGAAGMLCFRGHFLSRKTATSIIQGSRHENAFSSSSDSPKRCA